MTPSHCADNNSFQSASLQPRKAASFLLRFLLFTFRFSDSFFATPFFFPFWRNNEWAENGEEEVVIALDGRRGEEGWFSDFCDRNKSVGTATTKACSTSIFWLKVIPCTPLYVPETLHPFAFPSFPSFWHGCWFLPLVALSLFPANGHRWRCKTGVPPSGVDKHRISYALNERWVIFTLCLAPAFWLSLAPHFSAYSFSFLLFLPLC